MSDGEKNISIHSLQIDKLEAARTAAEQLFLWLNITLSRILAWKIKVAYNYFIYNKNLYPLMFQEIQINRYILKS